MAAKVKKAKSIRGTKVIFVLIPCLPGWGVADNAAVKTARLGVESGVYPLIEIENGTNFTLNVQQKSRPIEGYLDEQKRYRSLNEKGRIELQAEIDEAWERLVSKASSPRSFDERSGTDI